MSSRCAGPDPSRLIVFRVGDDATDLVVRIKRNITATGSLFALSEERG